MGSKLGVRPHLPVVLSLSSWSPTLYETFVPCNLWARWVALFFIIVGRYWLLTGEVDDQAPHGWTSQRTPIFGDHGVVAV
uniref:Uncharacterized protein n=1 Tax=Romanomermis culicivorax TaxID=13658 RepID=A0A915HI00_ROMCU